MTSELARRDEELLMTAAEAVIASFDTRLREQLPPPCIAALRLLETAIFLCEDSRSEVPAPPPA